MFRNGRQVSYAGEHSRDWIEQLEPPYINEKATDYDIENRESEQIMIITPTADLNTGLRQPRWFLYRTLFVMKLRN
jgi:hypothetical protein